MKAYITSQEAYQPLIQRCFETKNMFIFSLVRKGEVIRTIHISFKKALVLIEGNIRIMWMVEYSKENFQDVTKPYKCSILKLFNDLAIWVSETQLTESNHNYNLTESEARWAVASIIAYHFPFLSYSNLDEDSFFIKWCE